MHGALLGVMKTLLSLWFSPKYHSEPFYIPPQLQKVVDMRLKQIKPSSVATRPRKIADLSFYKAKDYRNFLLYYGRPSLSGTLSRDRLDHFDLFASAIYLLLKEKVSTEDVDIAERRLEQFVARFHELYHESYITMNIHLLLHTCRLVRLSGPLWAQSSFFFESNNGELMRSIKGPTDVLTQITKKYVLKQHHKNVHAKQLHAKFGDCVRLPPNVDAMNVYIQLFELNPDAVFYQTLNMNKTKFTSQIYSRAKKTCNYFVNVHGGILGVVKCYVKNGNDNCAIIETHEVTRIINHISEVQSKNTFLLCDVSEIKYKYMYVHLNRFPEKKYIITPPNLIEIF